jgi:DNA-directed RNA polymerase beta subunit
MSSSKKSTKAKGSMVLPTGTSSTDTDVMDIINMMENMNMENPNTKINKAVENSEKIDCENETEYFDIEKNTYNSETAFTIIESYFKGCHLERLVKHQLESYNQFVGHQIIRTIEMFNPVHIVSEQDYDPLHKKHTLEIYITFENFNIYRPQIHENNGAIKLMFPQEARLRNFTYASSMTIDINIKYIVRTGKELEHSQTFHKTLPNIHIGKLPIMLKSNICVLSQYKHVDHAHTGECKFDAGGYFIINGSEKTVLGQERAAENKVYCFNVSKNNTKYNWIAEMKSVPDFKCISPKQINMMISSKNNGFGNPIHIQIPRLKQPIPLFVVFRALGVLTDREICEKIVFDIRKDDYVTKQLLDCLHASVIDSNKHSTQEECIQYISSHAMFTPINMDRETGIKKKLEFTMDILNNDLFPHCHSKIQKIYFLGYMTNRLLQASLEIIKPDDRDSYINKRVDLTGSLLNNLFRNYFNKLVKDMEKQVIREMNNGSWKSTDDYENIINLTNIYKIIKSSTIENGIKRALATGDFGIKHTNSNKVGVAQVLNRLTYVSSLSHARRISTPTDKSGKLIPPRKLHNTTWGYLCPAETPEGQSVGIVKNLSYMTHITIYSNSLPLHEYVLPNIVQIESDELSPHDLHDKVKVFVNGAWVGITHNPQELYLMLKEKKYKGIINVYTSIVFDYRMKEIRVCNDSGRLCRPLLRVKNNNILVTNTIIDKLKKSEVTWDHLLTSTKLNESVIEYIDPEEQSWSMISTNPMQIINKTHNDHNYKYTHCEIHPSTIFGVLASCIPFPESNQSPRNCYQCLDINETVLLSNGNKIPIKHVKIGDEVMCFNPETLMTNYTKVVNHYVRETDKTICKIVTASGREIIATDDHKFMTTEGWMEVKNMVVGNTMIGILPYQQQNAIMDSKMESKIILSESDYRNICMTLTRNNGFTESQIDTQVEELKAIGLLPLSNTNYKLPVLARIFGYTFVDERRIGLYWNKDDNMYLSHSFHLKSEHDVKMFENDIEICGFLKSTHDVIFESNGYFTKYVTKYEGVLLTLLISLGIGYDTKKQKMIPNWIMEGSKIVKREFMSGYYGHYHVPEYNYNRYLMNQCMTLLKEFGVITATVRSGGEDDERTVSYMIYDTPKNKIKYCDEIGYRYNSKLSTSSFILAEYLRQKEWNSEIRVTNDFLSKDAEYQQWKNDIKIINNMVFMKIKSIEVVENRLISDITVESDDHSFIAGNNFLSSNCAQGKQAMGVYVTNYENRMDKTAYVLNYPMRPLVDTRIMNMIQLNKIPSGSQVIVAIQTHTGFNQEDSLLFNKGSIDRGLFVTTVYHTEKDEDKQKINGDEEIRCKPDATKTKGMKIGNYGKVNNKGVIPENTLVENRDIIIAKVTPIKENRNDHTKLIKYEDQSKIYRTVEETYIDKNYIDRNGEGYNFAKIRLRTVRKPVIGDKFSSRHGQKGTIGNIIPECDMPFTRNGVQPDIIINPHAIPSRMTIGQLKETLLGKVLLELGLFGDGTSFGDLDIDTIRKELLKVGYECNGNEMLYNGLTGEQMECSVFMGPVFYQRLKHMVNDKAHSRAIGPMVNLTRQPAEGRSRDGGLRFGEMEKDAMVSHGAARFTRERMYDVSDKYSVHTCKKCGLIASYNNELHVHHCRVCDNRTDFAYVEIPYACKLLFQELNTMNIVPRIMTDEL